MQTKIFRISILPMLLALFLWSCSIQNPSPSPAVQDGITLTGDTSLLPTLATETDVPTARWSECASGIANETVLPGTILHPGDPFTVKWELFNNSKCTWPTSYKLEFVGGDLMSAAETAIPISAVVPPEKTTGFSINMVAPDTAGVYAGEWALKDESGAWVSDDWLYVDVWDPSIPLPSHCAFWLIAEESTAPGTSLHPGDTFTQTWTLKNSGQCPWTTGYRLVFYQGDQMAAPESVFLTKDVPETETVSISVDMVAPPDPGGYRGYWMLEDSDGRLVLNMKNLGIVPEAAATPEPGIPPRLSDHFLPVSIQVESVVTTTPPTPTYSYCDAARLIEELPIAGGMELMPGQSFTKTWRVENIGDCTWNSSYQLVFRGGDKMSAADAIPLVGDVPVGETTDISVNMVAPQTEGVYQGQWMFKDDEGAWFGLGVEENNPLVAEVKVGVQPITVTPIPIDDLAVQLAKEVAPQFSEEYQVQFDPYAAKGLDAARVGGPSGQLAGMIAPVTSENQTYTDRHGLVRTVQGTFTISDPHLNLETMVILNKGTIQYSALPVGEYILACFTPRVNDCVAVSLDGTEYEINPSTIYQSEIEPGPYPSVAYEEGSIRKCFRIARRKICIKVF